ncbi:MAG: FGGY family carbohydrate kinase, partial [Acidimicrobiales bacterium]
MAEVTIGIDIGTTSVKAVAADGDGNVLARARIPHKLVFPAADRMQHDAAQAWRRGPRRALAEVDRSDARGVCVAAMVPSLTGVDRRGIPRTPGLLYG